MGRIGGWIDGRRNEDGSQTGGRLAASMWTSTPRRPSALARSTRLSSETSKVLDDVVLLGSTEVHDGALYVRIRVELLYECFILGGPGILGLAPGFFPQVSCLLNLSMWVVG